jgi:tetratricopeptide (TPR) repeat protein
MKKLLMLLALAAIGALALGNVCLAQAEKSQANAASGPQAQAQAAIKIGDIAAKNNNWSEAISDYKRAIELDPANAEAEKKFLHANEESLNAAATSPNKTKKKLTKAEREKQEEIAKKKRDRAEARLRRNVLKTYDAWIRKDPQQALFYWGKAEVLQDSGGHKSEAIALYHKAIQINPSCAPAYGSLADIAATDGNLAQQREYAEKALALDPKGSSQVFFNYVISYLTTDPAKFSQLVEARAARFPGDEYLIYLLDEAAENQSSPQKQERVFEDIYKDFGPKSAHPSSDINDVMPDLFNLYAKTDPAKAMSLAQRIEKDELSKEEAKGRTAAMPKQSGKQQGIWATLAQYEKNLVDARDLMNRKKYSDALARLDKNPLKPKGEFDPLNNIDQTPYELEKAEAVAGTGKVQAAYESLNKALVAEPDPALESALLNYGAKLRKSPAQVKQDMWMEREAKAKLMKPFDLKQYVTNKDVKLADFRSHVLLVNFWFPG